MTQPTKAFNRTLDKAFTVTPIALDNRRRVCYEFDTSATKADLALPYRVSIDGKVREAEGASLALTAANRKINLTAEPGTKIALFLNSDVHPDFRSNPVYALEVGDNDVLVKITEQTGRKGHVHAEVGRPAFGAPNRPEGRPVDFYTAGLTGDIWMQISHKYSATEANAFLPPDTVPTVRQAVLSIYEGLREAKLSMKVPASDTAPGSELRVSFSQSENAKEHITHCLLLNDVLPRTHPCAFASLFTAAYDAGVTDLLVTSCWRPMLGSIAHRAGLGIDVIHIANATQKVRINRVGLAGDSKNENVRDTEKKLYAAYLAAKPKQDGTAGAGQQEKALEMKIEKEAKRKWNEALQKNEPQLMNALRRRLQQHQSIKQVFDPWYMEANTADQNPPVANEQHNKNETLHANHLHVTIKEPKIL